jgi:hypothetical protein
MSDGPEFAPLEKGEELLDSPDELVFRHCAPGNFDEVTGKPTAMIFRATDRDAGKLSGARQSKTTAQKASEHRTKVLNMASRGTWAVSVAQIETAGSRAVDDSALLPIDPEPAPGHTYFDVRHQTTSRERDKFRSMMLIAANKRGRQHPAP